MTFPCVFRLITFNGVSGRVTFMISLSASTCYGSESETRIVSSSVISAACITGPPGYLLLRTEDSFRAGGFRDVNHAVRNTHTHTNYRYINMCV